MNTRFRVTALPALVVTTIAGRMAFPATTLAAARHDSAAAAAFSDLGLETLSIVVTRDAVTGMPDTIKAGRYLVDVSGEGNEGETDIGAMFFRFPDGMTLDTMPPIDPTAEMIPEFIYQGSFAGGRNLLLANGETHAQSIVTFAPGSWMIAGAVLSRPPSPFTVTGELPATLPTPDTDVELVMGEMYFHIVSGGFKAGPNTVSVTNKGGQPHFLIMMRLPDGTTDDALSDMLEGSMAPPSSPEADAETENEPPMVAILGDQSFDTTTWTVIDVEPGTYGLVCFFPDQHVGMPHAMLGMHRVVIVT